MSSIYDTDVDPLSPNSAHGIALQLVGTNKSVLELGAAGGSVSRVLKERGNYVVAVERDGRQAETLGDLCDEVLITDLNWLDLHQLLSNRKFDVILAGDVLEHCTNPELVLLQLHDLLSPDGYLVISIPNIAHADVRLLLLSGKFEYRESGLLDRTHLRFFTRETFTNFIDSNGFQIDQIYGVTVPIGATELGQHDPLIPWSTIEYIERDRDATVYQYIAKVFPVADWNHPQHLSLSHSNDTKTTTELLSRLSLLEHLVNLYAAARETPQLRQAHTELEQAHTELEQAHTELEQAHTELEQAHTELEILRLNLLSARDHAIGVSAELGEMRHRSEKATKEAADLRAHINQIRNSRTWKIGAFVLLPLRVLRRIIR
jgi:2-polyprenyl-3-methyl-5-hydroxy-6-metoxy-1,4-benzoquinol methylase/exonuclease VII small subunit